jgi:predicted nucleic acid-binding protein
VIICDTGPLVAAALSSDADHHASVELFSGMHLANRSMLVPGPVVAEVGYLLAREAGARVEALFLRSLGEGDFAPVDLTSSDYLRMSELVEEYGNLPLGTTDAAVVAVAERLRISEIATLDRRDFSIVRPQHISAFTLLP